MKKNYSASIIISLLLAFPNSGFSLPCSQNGTVVFFESALLDGKKVIIVSHSQGNLFSNQIYLKLEEMLTEII